MHLDKYVLHTEKRRYIEYSPATLVESLWNETAMSSLSYAVRERLDHTLLGISSIAPPNWLYAYSPKAYSVQVQAYIHAHTLNTNCRRHERESKDQRKEIEQVTKPTCEFCARPETEQHLFVYCRQFKTIREKTTKEIQSATRKIISKAEENGVSLSEEQFELLIYTASQILTDGSVWQDDECKSWMGFKPDTEHIIVYGRHIEQSKLLKKLHDQWHYSAVRMTGYIWGSRQQENWRRVRAAKASVG